MGVYIIWHLSSMAYKAVKISKYFTFGLKQDISYYKHV